MTPPLKPIIKEDIWKKRLTFVLSPFFNVVITPIRLAQTLWNCRVLAIGKNWDHYPNFQVHKSLNYLFYYTSAAALDEYGHSGVCPGLGLGNLSLARGFHYTLLSLYAYWRFGVVAVMVGMFGWLAAHAVWFMQGMSLWPVLILWLVFISTTFYANIFGHQNYNALGWMFFPLYVFALMHEAPVLQLSSLLFMSFGSFTVVVISLVFALVWSVKTSLLSPLLMAIPVLIKLSLHFLPLLQGGDLKSAVTNITKIIGAGGGRSKYSRKERKVTLELVYFITINFQFLFFYYVFTGRISVLLFTSILILILNSTYVRFADKQSLQMLTLSVNTALMLDCNHWALLPFFWVAISPFPKFLRFPSMHDVSYAVPKLSPHSIAALITRFTSFLQRVEPGKRVLMAFDDPRGDYNRIFDGYYVLVQFAIYVSFLKKIHFLPNYWAVSELNYEGAPELWGRNVTSVLKNAEQWNADFVIVYQDSGTALDRKWEEAGFQRQERFSWEDQEAELRGIRPYSGASPDWWLLKVPDPSRNPDTETRHPAQETAPCAARNNAHWGPMDRDHE